MKPFVKIAETTVPDGTLFSLHKHDGRFYLKNDGRDLMSTARTHSEELLADAGCASMLRSRKRPRQPRVLIGGLGLGFTLKRTLEIIGTPAVVQVAELVPEIVEWNRTFLAEANNHAVDDPRTDIYIGDFFDCLLAAGTKYYDAVLFDIDETPESLVVPGNDRMYSDGFFSAILESLKPNGCAAFWLSERTPGFEKRLRRGGFHSIEDAPAKAHPKAKRAHHHIYVGHKTPNM